MSKPDDFSWWSMAAAFFVTVLAIPMLLVATCLPAAAAGLSGTSYILLIAALFVGVVIFLAVRADDGGFRRGVIVGAIVTAAYALYEWLA